MIHVFEQNGFNIVLDVNSNAIHSVDDITRDILYITKEKEDLEASVESLKDKYPQAELVEAKNEIIQLIDDEKLFTKDFSEDLFIKKNHDKVVLKAMCLHMAHDCNLRCKYCFADEGSYGGKRSLMSLEVGKKAIEYLFKNSGTTKNVEVDFFGGEPMLNFEVIKECVSYGRSLEKIYDKHINYTITTNGTIMSDEIEKYLNENMNNIVLSIDGRKSVNDKMRPYPSGKGSYDKIIDNIKQIVANRNGKQYFVRGTYTRDNLDFYNDVKHLHEQGFKSISIEPVTGGKFALTDEETEIAKKEYERFAIEYANQSDYMFYHFNIDLFNSPCIYKRVSACGAGVNYCAVSPEGSIYACHQFTGEDEFLLGNVYDGISNFDLINKMSNVTVNDKEDCKECFAKYFCSGGCHALAYFTNNDLLKPDKRACELQKKRIECALMIQVKKALEE